MKKYILIPKLAALFAITFSLWQPSIMSIMMEDSVSHITETFDSFQETQLETDNIPDSEYWENTETDTADTEATILNEESGEVDTDNDSVQIHEEYEKTLEEETEPLLEQLEQIETENTQIEIPDIPDSEYWESTETDTADTEAPIVNEENGEVDIDNDSVQIHGEYEETLEEETDQLPEQTNAITDTLYEEPINFHVYGLPHEAIVYNYSELKNALANDNGITTVYFGSDIEMQGGIRINPKKTGIVINGLNPLNPGQTQSYTLTDFSSLSFYDTIYIDAVGTKTLLVRDLIITGKNYYGPFSVLDSTLLAGVTVTYERVRYNGPQFGYHRNGTIRFKDCTASIHGDNGGSPNQEFSEVKHVLFEGDNTIDTVTSIYTVFWHPLGGTFTIADDSSLLLKSPNTSTAYGIFYADGNIYKVNISIGQRAVLDMTISGIVAPELYVTLSGLTVHEGGMFYLKTIKEATNTVLKINGALIVKKDAKFIVSGYGGSSDVVLSQESGDITVEQGSTFQIIAGSPYMSLLNLAESAFICENPSSVLLYNANRNILASKTASRIYVNAQQINYRNKLSPGGLDDQPLYRWDRADKTNIWINGTLATGAIGDFLDISSNYISGDSPYAAPSPETFSMVDARILSFGRLELRVSELTTKSTSVSGITTPGATVRVSFSQQGVDYTFPDVTANSEGIFNVPIDVALGNSTIVKVKSSWQYLSETAEAIVTGEGNLSFYAPSVLEFYDTKLSSSVKTIKRLNPNWKILVSDNRGQGNEWSIYARLEKELTPDSAVLPILKDALIFIDEAGNVSEMSTDAEILILKHISNSDEETFPVTWDNDKGILLAVKPGTAFVNTVYTATISWTLVNGV